MISKVRCLNLPTCTTGALWGSVECGQLQPRGGDSWTDSLGVSAAVLKLGVLVTCHVSVSFWNWGWAPQFIKAWKGKYMKAMFKVCSMINFEGNCHVHPKSKWLCWLHPKSEVARADSGNLLYRDLQLYEWLIDRVSAHYLQDSQNPSTLTTWPVVLPPLRWA